MISDCCQYDPAARISDMQAVRERISLARTIVAKKTEDSTVSSFDQYD